MAKVCTLGDDASVSACTLESLMKLRRVLRTLARAAAGTSVPITKRREMRESARGLVGLYLSVYAEDTPARAESDFSFVIGFFGPFVVAHSAEQKGSLLLCLSFR
jgi:hypothetical protein